MKNTALLFVLVLACVLAPALLGANGSDFIPRFYDWGAEVRFFGSHDRDRNTIGDRLFGWDDSYFREKFTLNTSAYVYHPKFLQCDLSLSGVWRQEEFAPFSTPSTGWRNSTGVEYNLQAHFLPEHPYNLNLFAIRSEPLFKERTSVFQDEVNTSNGVHFRYRKKPYFLHAKYTDNTYSTNANETDVDTLSAGAGYFKELTNDRVLSLTADFNRPDFSDSFGLEGSSQQFSFSSLIRNHWLSFDTSFTRHDFNQDSPLSGTLESDQYSFLERVGAQLKWNFRTDFHYRYQKNSNAVNRGDLAADTISSTLNEIEFTLSHRLYESLDSQYTLWRTASSSTGGDSDTFSQYVNFNYVKRTPWGVLQAGLNLGRSNTDSTGQPAVINESHPDVPVPGYFTLLAEQRIDPLSIRVYLQSPLPPNELILLQETLHYSVVPEGETYRVQVYSLPPQFLLPDNYDFQVTYALLEGDFTLQTDTVGYRTSFDFFRCLMPYYTHNHADQELLDGYYPGALYTSNTDTVGVSFRKYGFQALAEYQNSDWPVNPYTGHRFEVRYSGTPARTLIVRAAAEHLVRNYDETFLPVSRPAYTDTRTTFSGHVQKHFFRRSMIFSAGGSYSTFDGLVVGDAYSLDSSLSWRIVLLDFTLGATSYNSNARSFGAPEYDRSRTYYFFHVGRKLF